MTRLCSSHPVARRTHLAYTSARPNRRSGGTRSRHRADRQRHQGGRARHRWGVAGLPSVLTRKRLVPKRSRSYGERDRLPLPTPPSRVASLGGDPSRSPRVEAGRLSLCEYANPTAGHEFLQRVRWPAGTVDPPRAPVSDVFEQELLAAMDERRRVRGHPVVRAAHGGEVQLAPSVGLAPRSAQNSSGSRSSSHPTSRPSASTIRALTSESQVSPCTRPRRPSPPPRVSPAMPTVAPQPAGMVRPCSGGPVRVHPQIIPPPTIRSCRIARSARPCRLAVPPAAATLGDRTQWVETRRWVGTETRSAGGSTRESGMSAWASQRIRIRPSEVQQVVVAPPVPDVGTWP